MVGILATTRCAGVGAQTHDKLAGFHSDLSGAAGGDGFLHCGDVDATRAGDPERIHRYAAELVALAPDIILAVSSANTGPPVSMLVKSAFGLSLKRVSPFTM